MKIKQELMIEDITATLSFEVPEQAVKTLIGDQHAFQEFCNTDFDVRQEAHPHICQAMSAALLQTYFQVQGSLQKALLEKRLLSSTNQAPDR